jgi:outer membrane protein OmpA-like peptidoglycan-associated protein
VAGAQAPPNPVQRGVQPVNIGQTPVYRVEVVARSTKAINYRHRSGATKIDFKGTPLLPGSRGEAKVESKQGYIEIEVEFDDLRPATQFGPEYLTYVMWAITPEGRATNLGEVLLNGTKSKLNVTTELQAFGLVVTAEPYFAVSQPSDVVVMENVIRRDTVGKIDEVDAKYELLKRGLYSFNANPAARTTVVLDSKTPLELHEARNAVQIARSFGADRYAADSFRKAEDMLRRAEDYHSRRAGAKPTTMAARESVQVAEDARLIAIQRIEEERLAKERQAAAERESRARAEAEAEAQRRALAEAGKRAAEAERETAELSKRQAELAAQEARRLKSEADQARAAAEAAKADAVAQQQALAAQAELARQRAADADRLREQAEAARAQAEADKTKLRQDLLTQLNMILETRDSARGLIVNMSDVLFDFNKYTLRPGAREKLAKISGIVLAHPGLKLEVEGHTDSVGSIEYNQRLSENRAHAVRAYLVEQGVKSDSITSRGFGKTMPVADNATAEGRQRNRRVELVVSGDVIGSKVESSRLR